MYIDKDSFGQFSINDLSERELRIIHFAMQAYARLSCHYFGNIPPRQAQLMIRFDSEYNSVITHGQEINSEAMEF